MFDILSDTFNLEMENNNDYYYNNNEYYLLDDQIFDEDPNFIQTPQFPQSSNGLGQSMGQSVGSSMGQNMGPMAQGMQGLGKDQQPVGFPTQSLDTGSGLDDYQYSNQRYNNYPQMYQVQSQPQSQPQSQSQSQTQSQTQAPPLVNPNHYQTPSSQSLVSSGSQSQLTLNSDEMYHPYYLHSANVDLSNLSTPSLTPQYSPKHVMYFDQNPMHQQVNQLNSTTPTNMNIPINYPSYNTHSQSSQSLHSQSFTSNHSMSMMNNPNGINGMNNNGINAINGINGITQPMKDKRSSPRSPSSPPNRKRDENKIITSNKSNFRIVRGVAAGGSSARPPKESLNSTSTYIPIELNIIGGRLSDIVRPDWSMTELEDKRRIIRIERFQKNEKIFVNFSIIGSAVENPLPLPPPANSNVDVIEVSCLQCSKKLSDEIDLPSPIVEDAGPSSTSLIDIGDHEDSSDYDYDYYITSVEVIEIVELLIGTLSDEPSERRKERGRVRSNLVPYWSKKPISSRLENNSSNQPDYKIELAKRIMSYEIRRPRGFDKEVRILKWEKLVPALKRALQSYYCEIPPIV